MLAIVVWLVMAYRWEHKFRTMHDGDWYVLITDLLFFLLQLDLIIFSYLQWQYFKPSFKPDVLSTILMVPVMAIQVFLFFWYPLPGLYFFGRLCVTAGLCALIIVRDMRVLVTKNDRVV